MVRIVNPFITAGYVSSEYFCDRQAESIELINQVTNGNNILSYKYNYEEILFRLPEKKKEVLISIAKEGRAKAVTGSQYIKKYSLVSASSVQAALKELLEMGID